MENEKPKGGGMEKLASFIVDKRNLFFLLYIFALIFSAIATGWVKVEDDITTYLPDTTETRQGLTVMNDNFVTYGTADVMVSTITYDTELDIQSPTSRVSPPSNLTTPTSITRMRRRCSPSALTQK